MLLYPLTMAVALAYFAEHYFIDAIAGWLVVGGSFLLWNRIEARLGPRSVGEATDAGRQHRERPRVHDELVSSVSGDNIEPVASTTP
tara:strand:+ start:121 stop:381 length:261 start_codon:yes stop_codon:yes gene_type:complete